MPYVPLATTRSCRGGRAVGLGRGKSQPRPDLCAVDNTVSPRDYMGKFWLDSLVHDPKMLEYIVDLVGENRVALGTDYPFPLGELQPGKLIHGMPWSEQRKGKLLHGAALEWLGMDLSHLLP